jgi:HPt (histidine-containing phosphotransfer) domain-containing protein
MPAMDGLEATAHIRQREQGTGRHVPIIGLTAHAMKGDREHGLASGMDDYVTKPLQLEELVKAIRQWVPQNRADPADPTPAFHHEKLLNSLGGDEAALRRLVEIFLETTPALVEKIRRAVASGDAAALLHGAHTLKGSLTHLDESKSRAAASELERLARAGTLDGTTDLFAELERNLILFEKALRQWLNSAE